MEGSILIHVKSSRILDSSVYYYVTSSVNKMMHRKANQARDKIQFDIRITVTPDCTPSTKLVVYFIHSSGEIVYDSVNLGFQRDLRNYVSEKLYL